MMSVADGVIMMEMGEDRQLLNVVKHPRARPARIQVPIEPERIGLAARVFDPSALRQLVRARGQKAFRTEEVGGFVNLLWPSLAHWSGMLWDPKRFPMMTYELNKEDGPAMIRLCNEDETVRRAFLPTSMQLLIRLFVPKSFSRVRDMKRAVPVFRQMMRDRAATWEYLDDVSRTDEHYFRMYECSDCCGFENVGAPMAYFMPPLIAGACRMFELWGGLDRDWNAVEIKCIGLGDPYCEFKLVPGSIDVLEDSLQKDGSLIEKIHQRLMDRLTGCLLHGEPLVERPGLGSDIHIHVVFHAMGFPHLAGARYQMALRMGGAKSGKELGERLLGAGLDEDEALKRVLNLLQVCKVGQVSMNGTIVIRENCETTYTKLFTTESNEPSCSFTTGFLNGLFSALKGQHVREIKCITMGDPYCEWEIV
jgi:predicted hydrocarbon binding protein